MATSTMGNDLLLLFVFGGPSTTPTPLRKAAVCLTFSARFSQSTSFYVSANGSPCRIPVERARGIIALITGCVSV